MNVLSGLPQGPFDLVFCSEVLYYLDRSQRKTACTEACPRNGSGGTACFINIFPRAQFLHRELSRIPSLKLLTEQLFVDEPPGYALALYQRTVAQ